MDNSSKKQAAKLLRDLKNSHRWLMVFLCLAVVVAVSTVLALTLPGQALTREDKVLNCHYNLHTHTDSCYDENGNLVCGLADYVVHTHGPDCYSQGRLVCTLPEIKEHQHTEECYETQKKLICTKDETSGHQHTAECYESVRGDLLCQNEEPDHVHTDECYDTTYRLVCDIEVHTHTDECYETVKTLVCDKPEIIVHTHTDACYMPKALLDADAEAGSSAGDNDQLAAPEGEDAQANVPAGDSAVDSEDAAGHTEADATVSDDALQEGSTSEDIQTLDDIAVTEGEPETGASEASPSEETGSDLVLVCGLPEVHVHQHDQSCFETITEMEANAENEEQGVQTEEPNGEESSTETPDTEEPAGTEELSSEDPQETTAADESAAPDASPSAEAADGEPTEETAVAYICGKEEHTHDSSCYDEDHKLICEKEEHTHTADCEAAGQEQEELTYICGKEEHKHTTDCYDAAGSEIVCGKEEHTHDLSCVEDSDKEQYYCGKEEHVHTDACYDKDKKLICKKEEHTHDLTCLVLAGRDAVLTVKGSGYKVVVTVPGEAIPALTDKLRLKVRELDPESEEYAKVKSVMEANEVNCDRLFDITLLDGDREIEPLAPVKISYEAAGGGNDEAGSSRTIYHVDVEHQLVEDMKGTVDADGSVTIETPHFSYYAPAAPIATPFTASKGNITLNENTTVGSITLTGNLTIDLNGHTLTVTRNNGFIVDNGYILTITDSKNVQPTIVEASAKEAKDKVATYDGSYLSYYVTKAEPTDIGTSDTTYLYTVDLRQCGKLISNGCVLIRNEGGTVNIQGGQLTNTGGAAITQVGSSKSLEITGGYICGCKNGTGATADFAGCNGGSIYATAGTITMSDGVIAANRASRGGGIYSNGAAVTVRGNAIISGNDAYGEDHTAVTSSYIEGLHYSSSGAWGGGGIYIDGAKLTLSGGWITNNISSGNNKKDPTTNLGYGCCTQGGGGVLADGTSKVIVNGTAQITGNYAENACGGIFVRYGGNGDGVAFSMNGEKACISSNFSNYREGGGIFLDRSQHGEILAGYITNNTSNTPNDWGGGGIFISGLSSMYMENTLVTKNTAEGFGGGVGGCPTGRLFLEDSKGVGVFDNTADGENLTHSPKSQDHDAAKSPAFWEGDFQDLFSALSARAYKKMLGNGDANWTGTVDFLDLSEADDHGGLYYQSGSCMGLTAHPSEADQNNAITQAKVFISGNHSNTHGGGLMCNGVISFGQLVNKEISTPLDIRINKSFVDADGNAVTMTEGQFTFVLRKGSKDGPIVARGKNNADGSIGGLSLSAPMNSGWKENVSYDAGTYYLMEEHTDKNGVITYDDDYFKIQLYARRDNEYAVGHMTIDTYRFFRADVWYYPAGGSAVHIINTDDNKDIPANPTAPYFHAGGQTGHSVLYLMKKVNGQYKTAFQNTIIDKPAYLHLVKEKDDGEKNPDGTAKIEPFAGVQFYLRDATPQDVLDRLGDTRIDGGGKLTGSNGRIDFTLQRGHTYYLRENPGDVNKDYIVEGPWIIEVEEEQDSETGTLHIWEADDAVNGADNWTKKGPELTGVWQDRQFNDGGTVSGSTTKLTLRCLVILNRLENEYQLPETGGSGHTMYTLSGLLLLAVSAALMYKKYRGRGEQSSRT